MAPERAIRNPASKYRRSSKHIKFQVELVAEERTSDMLAFSPALVRNCRRLGRALFRVTNFFSRESGKGPEVRRGAAGNHRSIGTRDSRLPGLLVPVNLLLNRTTAAVPVNLFLRLLPFEHWQSIVSVPTRMDPLLLFSNPITFVTHKCNGHHGIGFIRR